MSGGRAGTGGDSATEGNSIDETFCTIADKNTKPFVSFEVYVGAYDVWIRGKASRVYQWRYRGCTI